MYDLLDSSDLHIMGEGRVSYGVADSDDARDVGFTHCLRIFYGNAITLMLSGGENNIYFWT